MSGLCRIMKFKLQYITPLERLIACMLKDILSVGFQHVSESKSRKAAFIKLSIQNSSLCVPSKKVCYWTLRPSIIAGRSLLPPIFEYLSLCHAVFIKSNNVTFSLNDLLCSHWWFWSRHRSENSLTKFWTIWPLPNRGHAEVKWGQNFKMLQMTFHVYQITHEVIRITKIYSLLCVGCMVREILTKSHPKVKWGQIFNNIRFAWMIHQIIPLGLHIPKNIYF